MTAPTNRTEAEALAIALKFGLATVADAVAWADAQIAASDVPHVALCNVSMAATRYPQDVASMLRELPGEFDSEAAVRLALKYASSALRNGSIDPRDVARALYDIAIAGHLSNGDFERHALSFWDGIDLVRNGIGVKSESQIIDDMTRMLGEFIG